MRRAQFVLLALVALAATARADDPVPDEPQPHLTTPFDRGKLSLGIYGGSQSTLGYHYFAIGGAFGYFVLDGVEVSLGGLEEFGDGPNISKLEPELRYVVQPLVGKSPVIPYVGAFYNHWFIGGGMSDVDTVGGRGGLLYVSGQLVLGLGAVYERIVSDCVMDCSSVYPDFTISLAL